jgi:AraC-like DNA-binding protein
MSMPYREIPPPAALADVIDCYWVIEGGLPSDSRILPDGCADIIFDVTGAGGDVLVGAMTTAVVVSEFAPSALGVRFLPGGAHRVIGIPLSEITDASVALVDAAARLALAVRDAPDAAARIAAVNAFVAARCVADAHARAVGAAWRLIERQPVGTVRDLSARIGVGERTLQRSFLQHSGLTPKQAMRVARLRRAIGGMRAFPDRDLGRIALEAGYYDQPHFCHEFNRMTGLAPEDWRDADMP